MKRMLCAVAAGLFVLVTVGTPVRAQFFGSSIVFDPSNYAQNLLTAARALQQINNQIQSLQNQAMMLTNMASNLKSLNFSSLSQISGSLQQIDNLINQAQGIAFTVSATQAAITEGFPQSLGTVSSGQLLTSAETNWKNTMDAYRQTLTVQSQIVSNVQSDEGILSNLVTQSQGAAGNLQVQQAANQLLALSAKQQFQLETLLAAQYRADALDKARQAETDEESRIATKSFLGSGNAYTPLQ